MDNGNSDDLITDYCDEEETLHTFLEALPFGAAFLDQEGIILCCNQLWQNFARNNNLTGEKPDRGSNYIEIWQGIEVLNQKLVDKAVRGLKAVLAGDKDKFFLEYPCSMNRDCWFKITFKSFKNGALVLNEDITELKTNEEKLEAIFNSSLNVMYIIAEPTEDGRDAIIKDMSPEAWKVFGPGEELTREEVIEVPISRFFPEVMETKIAGIHRAVGQGQTITQKTKLIDNKGREVYVLASISSFRVGGKDKVISVFMDISEMEEAREDLRATLNSIGDAVIVTDTEGYITRMNPVAENLTDYSFAEAEGKLLTEVFRIVNARTRKPVKNPARDVLQTGKKVGLANDTLLIARDGSEYQIADSASPIRDEQDNMMGVVLVFRDITEQYDRQKKIESQQKRLQGIIEGTNAGTWEWNVQTGETIFNERWAAMLGYKLEELSPVSIETWRELTHPDDLERSEEILKRHFRGEIEQYDTELRMKHKQGHWVWLRDRGRVISWTEEGKPLWMFGTHLDISDHKNKEERIRYVSNHDTLTDLYNRTFMEKEIKKLDTENQLPISIIMIDINGLKIINEAYGHQRGDLVLIKATEVFRSCVREEDIVARWAGGEFIILLPETEEQQTREIVKRIKEKSAKTKTDDVPLSLGIGYALKTESNQDIYELLYRAEDEVYKDKLTKNRSAKNKMVQNMLNTLGAKSDETREHAQRMTTLSYRLGEELGLSIEQLNNLSLLATLHDIGKVNIAEEILKKPTGLTKQEWEAIKEHTEKGYAIASSIEEFSPIAECILAHHERWDGDGYPRNLEGEEIPLLARIISIVDAYDVMTNGRPYKEAMNKDEAIAELKRCAGSQFDPQLVKKFVEIMNW